MREAPAASAGEFPTLSLDKSVQWKSIVQGIAGTGRPAEVPM